MSYPPRTSVGWLVGYATYGLDEESGIAAIGNNAVHPAHQGKGIGSRLQREVDRRMHEKLGYRRYAETYRYLRKG